MILNRKSIKICFVSGAISRSGGTERIGSVIANALANQGYDVTVLSCWNHGTPYFPLNEKVKVLYLLDPKTEGKIYRTYLYPIVKMHKYISKYKFNIIIDIDTELARFTSFAKIGTNCKQISWEHFNYWTMLKLKEKKRFRAKELIKKSASRLVVLTEEDRQKHIEKYELPQDFVITMPNPCLSEVVPNYQYTSKTFLTVGRLAPPKNYSALLNAWKIVEDAHTDWNLVIVGKGELEGELKKQMKNLGFQRVCFAGHSDHVEEYYKKAACFVLSSAYEGFPMVILEAQSFGLPVISFDCKTGPRDLVHNEENGYLVEDGNVRQLAERMIEFTKNKDRADGMSKSALKEVQQYNLPKITEKWCQLIDDVYLND